MASIILYIAFFTITFVNGRRRLHMCPDEYLVAWKELVPPYTEIINNTAGGILLDIFKEGMRSCCNKGKRDHVHFQFTSQYDINYLVKNETTTQLVEFMLPLQRDDNARNFLGHPFVPIVVSPGFALFLKPPGNSINILLNALKPVLPILAISMLAVAIAGVLFWMIENMTLAWNGETPERFIPGVWNGVWWAFVTMTTIGYGDLTPKTKLGRIFSVLWVLAGITLCGVLVSAIASVLIEALSRKPVTLMNQNIGVMYSSEEYRYAFKKLAIPHQFDTIREISIALQQGRISMAMVDVLVVSRYKEEFKDFILDRIIEHMTSNGVVFLPRGKKYSSCIHQFVLDSQREIINNVSKILKGTKYKSYSRVDSSSIIDPHSPAVQYVLLSLFALIVLLTIGGLIKEWFSNRKISKKEFDEEEEARLLKEFKEAYHRELIDLINLLKMKCEDGA